MSHSPGLKLKDLGVLQKTLAPITSADLFKPDDCLCKPKSSIQVNRFLSREARIRAPSSLKASVAALGIDVISFSTGRPSPETYPFEQLDLTFSDPAFLTSSSSRNGDDYPASGPLRSIVYRNDPDSSIDISIALSYGYSLGCEQLLQFLTTHITHVLCPPYSDWEICLTVGNTSALEIALRNFANEGDCMLVEEYSYSGMLEAARALNLNLVPIAMDSDGLCSRDLEAVLSSWESCHPDKPKPRLLYTIPTGHNPTGITQPPGRRREVLAVADKHDLLIIEDDPYYYLHFSQAGTRSAATLLPSYLSLSTAGRVIRLDTTSKILAPGLRLGWLTAPKAVVETFQAAHDLGIVHPSGLSQVVVYKLLSEAWGHDGFVEWLAHLADEYGRKARLMLQAMRQALGHRGLEDICSWKDIEAGMFIWLTIDCSSYPGLDHTVESMAAKASIEEHIYTAALEAGVLCCRGSFFCVPSLSVSAEAPDRGDGDRDGDGAVPLAPSKPIVYLRLTFASVSDTDLVRGIERLATALREVFGLT
ncbi:hypothetical protein A1O3_04331 [Capronia epimyces CBS 606.96]|uniref:Aminotransferase class I/classII large domain-containing protein n=1 Tax=Capronia epimyces CBS 606.96 TaxID=1182542 RepID=W9Y3K9_9EURO|nr:uncharacterized protein A1O3_04331 [Capronia epimyces CBS 606.96]EXJ87372.1 hypothetical protein A1O3_04331 [Capronia epimyces CBS 606.96]